LYDGTVPSGVRILESQVAFGTGDSEDEPHLRDDKARHCFYVEWATAGSLVDWRSAGHGPFRSLAEAETYVSKTSEGTVTWES